MCLINKQVKDDDSKQLFAFTLYLSNLIQADSKIEMPTAIKNVNKFLKKRNINLKDYKFIGVPVNITKSHWYSFLIEPKVRKFTVLDSMHSTFKVHHKKTFDALK